MHDPFDILGIQPCYDLDLADLHRRMITLSAEHHPDRFTDPVEQADAADRAARINGAYRVLADPARRAEALVRRLGLATPEDEKALPPDLLMRMMEVREELEEATAGGDIATLERLRTWARQQRDGHLAALARCFAEPGDDLGRRVRLELNSLRYVERMLEQMPATLGTPGP